VIQSPSTSPAGGVRAPSTAELPRVLVCDARPIVRAGLAAVLGDDGLVGDGDLATSLARIDELAPTVLVAGLRIDDPDTFQLIGGAKLSHPDLRVLVIADGATVIDLREAVIAGVDSFVLTSAPIGEIREAVLRTARGERIISPSIAMQLAGSWRQQSRDAGASALSPREIEVLQLLAEGLTNQQVGARLGLSSRTVKTHVQNLLIKLEAPDRTGAVARAFRLGLIR
jgi:DNA-binding NarL/FixJ family response regulator